MEIDAKASESVDMVRSIGDPFFPIELNGVRQERGKHGSFYLCTLQQSFFDRSHLPLKSYAHGNTWDEQQVAPLLRNKDSQPRIQARCIRHLPGFLQIVIRLLQNTLLDSANSSARGMSNS